MTDYHRVVIIPQARPPTPRDLEERSAFEARCLKSGYGALAVTLWSNAKLKSTVSVKNSEGEWLMFD